MLTRRTPLKRASRLRAYTPLRRSRIKPRPPGVIPLQTREALKRRARNLCERCKVPDYIRRCQAHHRKLKSQGGTDDLSNLAYLCGGPQGCHGWAHDNCNEAIREGWIIPSGAKA